MRQFLCLFFVLSMSFPVSGFDINVGKTVRGAVEKGKEVAAGVAEAIGFDYTVDESTRAYVKNISREMEKDIKTAAEKKRYGVKMEIQNVAMAEQKKLKDEITAEMQIELANMKREIEALAQAEIMQKSEQVMTALKSDIYEKVVDLKGQTKEAATKVNAALPEIITELKARFDTFAAKIK